MISLCSMHTTASFIPQLVPSYVHALRVRVDYTPVHFNILNFADAIELQVISGGDCLVASNDSRTHKLYHRDSC
jgi:hypothetical protein